MGKQNGFLGLPHGWCCSHRIRNVRLRSWFVRRRFHIYDESGSPLISSNSKRFDQIWCRHCFCRFSLWFELYNMSWKVSISWPFYLAEKLEENGLQNTRWLLTYASRNMLRMANWWLHFSWIPWSNLYLSNERCFDKSLGRVKNG